MSRVDAALRALDANRNGSDYGSLLDVPAQVPEPDLAILGRLVEEHPGHADDLTEIFTVAATAKQAQSLDEDALDMLSRPRDVLAPAHGLSEKSERVTVLALVLLAVAALLLSAFVDTPTVDLDHRYTTTQETPIR